MITDGIIKVKDELGDYTNYQMSNVYLASQINIGDYSSQVEENDNLAIYKVTQVIIDAPVQPNKVGLECIGRFKEWEHHVTIEL